LKFAQCRLNRILSLLVLLAILPAVARCQAQPSAQRKTPATGKPAPPPFTLEGHWVGSLQVGDAVLHLVLHISKAADGSWKATLDSLDQGVYGIEVSSIAEKENALTFLVTSVGAAFEGKIPLSRQTINGFWSQGGAGIPLVFHREVRAGSKSPADAVFRVEGVWQGALETTGMRLRFQLHVSHDDKKHLVAALDSPDQGINGLPATKVEEKQSAFHFEIPLVNVTYDGTINTAHNTIAGIFTQSGEPQKLDFRRGDELLELRRPQNPVKPYPYREEEIAFSNAQDHVSLAATLTIPSGPGPFPATILICGSGPNDRDEAMAGHKLFLVLADHLTRKGFAVLRYDKRGIGKSTGNYAEATAEDFAADTEAAIAYLKSRKEIDTKKIGLLGHSEGGVIAPMVAARSHDVAWVVLLAGPGVKGENIVLRQSELIERTAGIDEAQIQKSLTFDLHVYALLRKEKDPAALEARLNELVNSTGMNDSMAPAALQAQLRRVNSPWFRFFLDYDPVPALEQTKCPVLALNGEKDLQVPAKDNLPVINKALAAGGNTDFETAEMPGLNHLFQHCLTGSPTEYGAIEETIAPGALERITEWMQKRAASAVEP
jgi:pimeloyl-ACP methyl ester carboxylesterase